MQGLSMSSLKKHPALLPLFFCTGLGVIAATFYTIRLAVKSPEVSWQKRSNPEPWNEFANKQHKFYSPFRDYSKTETQAPKY